MDTKIQLGPSKVKDFHRHICFKTTLFNDTELARSSLSANYINLVSNTWILSSLDANDSSIKLMGLPALKSSFNVGMGLSFART